MYQRNDGRGEVNSLQNHFTAYLSVAASRFKRRYLEQQNLRLSQAPSCDFQETPIEPAKEPDMLAGLPLTDLLKSEALLQALGTITPRDREVLLDLIVYEMMPAELGVSYQGTTSVYYLAKRKLLENVTVVVRRDEFQTAFGPRGGSDGPGAAGADVQSPAQPHPPGTTASLTRTSTRSCASCCSSASRPSPCNFRT